MSTTMLWSFKLVLLLRQVGPRSKLLQLRQSNILLLLVLQRDFTVRIQSKSALTTSDVRATNGEVTSVTPVAGNTGSYDVAVASKSKTGTVAVSTIASAAIAASTITVDVDTTVPQVTVQPHPV